MSSGSVTSTVTTMRGVFFFFSKLRSLVSVGRYLTLMCMLADQTDRDALTLREPLAQIHST